MNKHILTEIQIRSSRQRVWEILSDFDKYPLWNPFIVSIKGNLKEGTKLQNTLRNKGKNFVITPTIKEVNPGHGLSWLGSLWFKGLFDGYHYFEIRESGSDEVTLIHGEKFSGILSGIILRQIGKDTLENFQHMNYAIKQEAERI